MNYIPGFSQHLQQFAQGGPARFVEEDIYDGVGQFEQPMTNVGAPSSNSGLNFGASEALKQKLAAEAMAAMDTPRRAAVAPYASGNFGLSGGDLSSMYGRLFNDQPPLAQGAGPIAEPARQAAVTPMTQETVAASPEEGALAAAQAAYAASQARSDASADFMTKQLAAAKANPNSIYELANPDEYYKAYGTVPISFTGNSAYMDKGVKGPSIDYLTPEAGATYSLYSPKTGQLISSGSGAEGLTALAKQANALNESQGRKADFQLVKTSAGSSSPEIIGSNLYNSDRTKLGKVAGVVGQALPLATLAIPGLNVLGGIAVGAGLGGVGAAMQGKNALKGAAMGGLSAAGGSVLGKALQAGGAFGTAVAPRLATAIGTGIGSTAGGLVTGQSLKNSLLSGVASGGLSYLSPSIVKGLGINQAAPTNANTSGGGDGFDGIRVVGGKTFTPGLTLGGSPNKIQQALNQKTENPYDGLTVTGNKFGNAFGVDLGGNTYGAPGQDQSAFDKMYSEPYDPNEILVKATPAVRPTPVSVPVTGALDTDIVVNALGKEKGLPEGSVLADLGIPQVPAPDPALTDKKDLGVGDYLEIASLLAGLIPDGKGNNGSPGAYGGTGSGRLNPIFSAKLPTAGGGLTSASSLAARPLGEQDWLTYGTRPELRFFENVADGRPAPITTPIPNVPSAPAMYNPEEAATRFAHGGALPAKRGGQSDRTEFAVNGPGTGRSDDIPAVLSDGEYVMDAETVALLGDGSSKAGAKKLDDLRVKVRKHKGQKLAKGRFSANAKKPEAYLSGGRI